jgi:hypothetical protein
MLTRGQPVTRGRRTLAFGAALVLALAAAGPAAADEAGNAALAALEQRLLDAPRIQLGFDIRAVGAVQAALSGSASLGPGNDARIIADGSFDGAPAAITLDADGETMGGGNGDARFEDDAPPALREGMIIGLIRMGLLHNLAVLSSGAPPEKTDGTVRDWVTYGDVTIEPDEIVGGLTTRRLRFAVIVGGQPAAIAELWVDAKTGLPVRRVQVVNFDGGEMRVLEQYPEFSIGGTG